MGLVFISRNSGFLELESIELLRYHGEYTTHDPEGVVRMGNFFPDLFFPAKARTWIVSESFKGIIERELNGILFDPVGYNRLVEDPGNMDIALAQARHESDQPAHGVLDYFQDIDEFHKKAAAIYWMRLPLFGTGHFMPEITDQIVKCHLEHLFLNERAYLKYVTAFLTDDLIDRLPIFSIHSSLAVADWLYDSLEPIIDFQYYQVSTLHET